MVRRRRRPPDPRQEHGDQYRAFHHHAAQDHDDGRSTAARSQADDLAQWSSFGANNDLPAGYLPSTSYELVNLYLTYQATKDITLTHRSTTS